MCTTSSRVTLGHTKKNRGNKTTHQTLLVHTKHRQGQGCGPCGPCVHVHRDSGHHTTYTLTLAHLPRKHFHFFSHPVGCPRGDRKSARSARSDRPDALAQDLPWDGGVSPHPFPPLGGTDGKIIS